MVAPSGNIDPDGGRQLTFATEQLSETCGVAYETAVELLPAGAVTDTFPGHVIDGGDASFTVTVNEQLVVFEPSFAVQVTVVTPFAKADPDGGAQATTTPEQLSEAVAEK